MSDFVVLLVLLLGSAFFAGTELAVTMASRIRVRTHSEHGSRLARRAERLLARPERAIALCLVGNNLVNVGIAVFGREVLLSLFPMRDALLDTVTAIVFVPIVLLFGEVIPKAVSQSYPNRVLVANALPLMLVGVFLAPLFWLALLVAELTRRLAGLRTRGLHFASREELKQFVARSELGGHVDADERDLIYQIFEFWKLDPRELVRPLASLPHIPEDKSVADAKRLMREKGLARLLVASASGREIVGVVTAARVLTAPNDESLSRYVEEPVRMEQGQGLDRLLSELQAVSSQVAVLRGWDGRPGVVLLDDLLDQLLGRSENALKASKTQASVQAAAPQKRP